jgi:hypothetical protein
LDDFIECLIFNFEILVFLSVGVALSAECGCAGGDGGRWRDEQIKKCHRRTYVQ